MRRDNITPVNPRPEFIRLQRKGRCFYTGLGRSKLSELIMPTKENNYTPLVKSVNLCTNGKKRGLRLIELQSLFDYLHGEVEKFQESIRKEALNE
jgi:hypothetical protein|tara:strand:+ start:67 stop:351 length:285 start_codon:yes stop_codon:yes gene_type:complete